MGLTGLTSPWNTFAIYDLHKLAKVRPCPLCPFLSLFLYPLLLQTGFLPISDTNTTPGQSAIEEVPTISLHQFLFPYTSRAVLVKFPSETGWDTRWYVPILHTFSMYRGSYDRRDDPDRVTWQKSKMASKNTSASSHLAALALPPGVVRHLSI